MCMYLCIYICTYIYIYICIYIFFFFRGSVHRNSILIRSNKMQKYAGINLLQIILHVSVVHRTHNQEYSYIKLLTAASGTATTFLQSGHIWPRWRRFVVLILWPVPEATVRVLYTPDDGCDGYPKHVEWFAVNKYLHIVASCWIFFIYISDVYLVGTY